MLWLIGGYLLVGALVTYLIWRYDYNSLLETWNVKGIRSGLLILYVLGWPLSAIGRAAHALCCTAVPSPAVVREKREARKLAGCEVTPAVSGQDALKGG